MTLLETVDAAAGPIVELAHHFQWDITYHPANEPGYQFIQLHRPDTLILIYWSTTYGLVATANLHRHGGFHPASTTHHGDNVKAWIACYGAGEQEAAA